MLMLGMANNFLNYFSAGAVSVVAVPVDRVLGQEPTAIFVPASRLPRQSVGGFRLSSRIAAVLRYTGSLDSADGVFACDQIAAAQIHITARPPVRTINFHLHLFVHRAMGSQRKCVAYLAAVLELRARPHFRRDPCGTSASAFHGAA